MSSSAPGFAAPARVLVVDEDAALARRLGTQLAEHMAQRPVLVVALSGRSALEQLRASGADALIVSLGAIADLSPAAEEAMSRLCRAAAGAIVIALSDGRSVSAALAAMGGGAHDCLAQPVGGRALATRLAELSGRHGRSGSGAFGLRPDGPAALHGLVGSSSQMQVVFEQIERIAASDAPVFITGEVGTGKSLVAEALHRAGPRAARPFIVVSGIETHGALLFPVDREGATLFIDEIGDLGPAAQAALLERLDRQGEAEGGMRYICATRENPLQLIAERRLREDLFYRLHVLPLNLPPLRQRTGDAVLLAEHFLARFAAAEGKMFDGFAPEALARLSLKDWPGNVRQLEMLVRRIVVMHPGGEIGTDLVDDDSLDGASANGRVTDVGTILPMWRQEQRIIEDAINRCNGNIALAAQALELSPSTIYRKRQAWAELEARQGAA